MLSGYRKNLLALQGLIFTKLLTYRSILRKKHDKWLFICFFSLFILMGCQTTAPKLNLVNLQTLPADQEQTRFPPTPDEIRKPREYIAVVLNSADEQVSRYARALSQNILEAMFEKHGNLRIISNYRVQQLMYQMDLFGKDLTKEESLVGLGEALKVKYIAVLDLLSAPQENENDWSTNVNFKVYQLRPTKLKMSHRFQFKYSNSRKVWNELKTPDPNCFSHWWLYYRNPSRKKSRAN